jgi:hypothetical protein
MLSVSCQRAGLKAGNDNGSGPSPQLTNGKRTVENGSLGGADGPSNTDDSDTSKDKDDTTKNEIDKKKQDGDSSNDDPDSKKKGDGSDSSDSNGDSSTNNPGRRAADDNSDEVNKILKTLDDLGKVGRSRTLDGTDGDTPIVLDWNRDGLIQTAAKKARVWFDIDDDGRAEIIDWLSAGDAFLCRDLDNNGKIDSGKELFGSGTELAPGKRAVDGFAALISIDSNKDGAINEADPAFASLMIWQDLNQNGLTDKGEMHPAKTVGLKSLSAVAAPIRIKTGPDSELRLVSTFTFADGKSFLLADIFYTPKANLAATKGNK